MIKPSVPNHQTDCRFTSKLPTFKTGYNFEFKDGRYIFQPNLLVSYTFVNTFDYTNAAGVKIDADPLHAIQVSSGFKMMANTKNGWQPYIAVNMVMNFMDKSKVTVDTVRLPGMSTRPYVQYGIGLQKTFKDHFMAFGQTMFASGGRHGMSITAGLRWAIGNDNKKEEQVQNKTYEQVVNTVKQDPIPEAETKSQVELTTPVIPQFVKTEKQPNKKNPINSQYQRTTSGKTIIKQLGYISDNNIATTKTLSQGILKIVQ